MVPYSSYLRGWPAGVWPPVIWYWSRNSSNVERELPEPDDPMNFTVPRNNLAVNSNWNPILFDIRLIRRQKKGGNHGKKERVVSERREGSARPLLNPPRRQVRKIFNTHAHELILLRCMAACHKKINFCTLSDLWLCGMHIQVPPVDAGPSSSFTDRLWASHTRTGVWNATFMDEGWWQYVSKHDPAVACCCYNASPHGCD